MEAVEINPMHRRNAMHSMIKSKVWSVCREPVDLLFYDLEDPYTTREIDLAIFENVFTQIPSSIADDDRIMWWLEDEFKYEK